MASPVEKTTPPETPPEAPDEDAIDRLPLDERATARLAARRAARAQAKLLARAEARRQQEELEAAAAASPSFPPESAAGHEPVRIADTRALARELRKVRKRRLLARLGVFVLLPTALSAAYYGFFASSQYESYSMFTIHSAELRPTGGLESLLSVATGGGGRDVLAVRDYVLSRDMLARLDKEHGFIAHYRTGSADWWSRLGADASFEDAYKYFDEKVHADYDTASGSMTLRVRAFTPEKANEFARAALSYSEEMVNKLSDRERSDRTKYAEDELKKSEERLSKARKELLALQQKHSEFNPMATAEAAISIRTSLEGELAKARAEVMELRSYMNADAPQVLAAQQKVNAISAQVAQESKRLVDPKRDGAVSGTLGIFEAAMVEKEFAEKAYGSALAALELARSDAARQHRYLATIASPSKPDESTYPRPIRAVITVFVVSFLLMGIGTLMSAAVREHARL